MKLDTDRATTLPPAYVIGIERFTAGLPVLPFDAEAASHFGAIRAHLRRAGTPITARDMLIGARPVAKG